MARRRKLAWTPLVLGYWVSLSFGLRPASDGNQTDPLPQIGFRNYAAAFGRVVLYPGEGRAPKAKPPWR